MLLLAMFSWTLSLLIEGSGWLIQVLGIYLPWLRAYLSYNNIA